MDPTTPLLLRRGLSSRKHESTKSSVCRERRYPARSRVSSFPVFVIITPAHHKVVAVRTTNWLPARVVEQGESGPLSESPVSTRNTPHPFPVHAVSLDP